MSKAEKLRRHRARQDMPGLAATPKRKARGRKRMEQITVEKIEKPEDTPVLAARARQIGIDPEDAKAEWLGCSAGRAMASVVQGAEARSEAWNAIQHMRRVQASYDRAIGSPNRHAQCLRIMLPVDEMHADASSPAADLRTEAEKATQAVSAWMRLQGWLGYADKRAAGLCKRVVVDDERCPDATAMVSALLCVVDGLAGRRIVYRGA